MISPPGFALGDSGRGASGRKPREGETKMEMDEKRLIKETVTELGGDSSRIIFRQYPAIVGYADEFEYWVEDGIVLSCLRQDGNE